MPYAIEYPDSGSAPCLQRVAFHSESMSLRFSPIGALEPCDPTDLEMESFDFYLASQRLEPPAGTVVRIGSRTFACIRSSIVCYYHLA